MMVTGHGVPMLLVLLNALLLPSISLSEMVRYAYDELDRIELPRGMEWLGQEEEDEARSRASTEDDGEQQEEEISGRPVEAFLEWAKMVARQGGAEQSRKEEEGRRRPMRRIERTNEQKQPRRNNVRRPPNMRKDMPCLVPLNRPVSEHRTHPRVWELPDFNVSALPRRWDWRDVNGTNYCSANRNQHIPVYCGGCWVFGTLGALQDRFNVARENRWPMTHLSPQEIIACNGHGSCNGGTAQDVLEHARIRGMVEEGCNNYKAVNEKCTPFTRCGSCWPDSCFALYNYTRYYIKDYGTLSGRAQMMAEIQARGPIACSISATERFDREYSKGIYEEMADAPHNHIVSVTGWGWDEATKTEYWIVRNSWGDAWGEMGWFRIVTSLYKGGRGDQYNLGIERECYFADPDTSNLGAPNLF